MITPPTEEAGELSNEGLAVGRVTWDNEDRVVVADVVMGCNILEWAREGNAKYFLNQRVTAQWHGGERRRARSDTDHNMRQRTHM